MPRLIAYGIYYSKPLVESFETLTVCIFKARVTFAASKGRTHKN